MKKIISKIYSIVTAIIVSIISLPSKIFALSSAPELQLDYGVPDGKVRSNMEIWLKTLIIPIAFLIGIIIYVKKSKSSKKKKILITIASIIVATILYFVVNKIIYKMY